MATLKDKLSQLSKKVNIALENESMEDYYDTKVTITMLDVTMEIPFGAEPYNQFTNAIEQIIENEENYTQPLEIRPTLLDFMTNNVGKEQLCMVCDEHGELVTTIIKDINYRYEKNLSTRVLNRLVKTSNYDNYFVNGHEEEQIEVLFIYVE